MRAGRLLISLLVAALIAVGASWLTYKHDYVVHERAAAEWVGLALAKQAVASVQQPQNADAAMFLSNDVIGKALKQLVGTTITPPASKFGDLKVTVTDVRLQPSLGITSALIVVDVASVKHGATVKVEIEGNLAFRGITSRPQADGHSAATAEFSASIIKAEPHFTWGFLDLPGRRFLSEAISSGLMVALDNRLTVAVPFEDRLTFNTGFSSHSTVRVPDGTVTFHTSLQGKTLEQRFSFSSPLFLRSGVWLLATASPSGQGSVSPPPLPNVPVADLANHIAALRDQVSTATRELEQHSAFILLLKGSTLVSLVDQLKALPEANRTVVVQSTGVTGHLQNGDLLVELPGPNDVSARMLINQLSATWIPEKGVALGTDVNMNVAGKLHVHVKPVVNMGTVLGLEGSAGKHIAGTLELSNPTIDGHSVLLLGAKMPCDTVTADVTTDGRLVAGPAKIDLVKVGVRWTMPVPPALGQPNLVLDDLPRRVPIANPTSTDQEVTVRTAHKAVEYTVHVTNAQTTRTGYIIVANLDVQPVSSVDLPAGIVAQRQALAASVAATGRTATACPAVDPDMKVLVGGLEFGKNNEFVKAIMNAISDLTKGPGPSNDLVGQDGFVMRNGRNVVKDVIHGPGPNHDLVGRNGAVRRFLGL